MYPDLSANAVGAASQAGRLNRLSDCVETRDTEVQRALSDLHSVIQRYDHVVGRLSSRLNSVVIPCTPAVACQEDKVSQGYQTDLGNTINSMRCQARDITDNLESLLDRIEL